MGCLKALHCGVPLKLADCFYHKAELVWFLMGQHQLD